MMKKALFAAAAAACVVLVAGCNTLSGQPQIQSAVMEPPTLKPGDSAVITLKLNDKHGLVRRVEGVVVEDARITFRLNDEGREPDAKAGDGIWSMAVDVPFQAPPGGYVLQLTAYGADGIPVPVRDKNGTVSPLQASLPVSILKPE